MDAINTVGRHCYFVPKAAALAALPQYQRVTLLIAPSGPFLTDLQNGLYLARQPRIERLLKQSLNSLIMNYSSPDLTQHPPRGPRVRLGGYVVLARAVDKCRATLQGKNGEYHYACPTDERFFEFAGLDGDALKAEVKKGGSDAEILAWIGANAKNKHSEWEIAQWSAFMEQRAPSDNESREFFNGLVSGAKSAHREDIRGWFDLLDLDDYVTFGGKP